MFLRVELRPKSPEDALRLERALRQMTIEDSGLTAQPGQLAGHVLVAGTHEHHLEIILDRLAREFRVEAGISRPEVVYREALTCAAEGEAKYARHTGSVGHYAHVKLRISPGGPESGYVFENRVTGGAIPEKFMNVVDEGIRDALSRGVIAGSPVHDVRVEVHDGSYHHIDSNAEAFRVAASLAALDAARKAQPVLLEPVMRVTVVVPREHSEAVVTSIAGRRGQLQSRSGVHEREVIQARVLLAELFGYESELRERTRWQATVLIQFDEYVPVRRPDDRDRDSLVMAPHKPLPTPRKSSIELPEPGDDDAESGGH